MEKCICCNIILVKYINIGNFCPKCHSVFATNIPTDEELAEYYKFFNEDYHGGGRTLGSKKRQLQYAEKYLKVVDQFSNGKLLIDIGSSNNPFPNIAHSQGYKVTVVDYVKPQKLSPEICFIESNIENLITIDKNFEIVTAFAIIEHTKDPLFAINNLRNLCMVNGIIVIYIPEIGRFPDNYSLGTTNWFCPPEHLNLLSKKALIKLMGNNCKLKYYKRFELNILRYLIRYGIGILEGSIGYIVKLVFGERIWFHIRQKRKSKYQGMSMFVFKKIE